MVQILALDKGGTPHSWISVEEAAMYYAKDLVLWELGSKAYKMLGGINSISGERSAIEISSIISVKGDDYFSKNYSAELPYSRKVLFARDRHLCAYCGYQFKEELLEAEHVIPQSRGGATSWTNLVSACRGCNSKKDDRTPKEAGMELLYVPYVPNRHEAFILRNRKILADQMDFLLSGVPKHSRLL